MLIEKVSKNIVSKSKCCFVVAEELRKLHKKLNKKNLTRFDFIYDKKCPKPFTRGYENY